MRGAGSAPAWHSHAPERIALNPLLSIPVPHTHDLSEVSELPEALALLAPKSSPALTGTPTAPTADPATNTTQLATTAFVQAVAAALYAQILGGAPAQLDTLNEIVAALGNDPNLAATLLTAISARLPLSLFVAGGDLPVGTGAGAASRLAKGANGYGPITRNDALVSGINHAIHRGSGQLWPITPGRYYAANLHSLTLSNLAGVANRIQLYQYTVPEDMNVDQLAIRCVTGVASATCRVGIYAADANRKPAALLFGGTSNLDCSVSGTTLTETAPADLKVSGGDVVWLATWHSSTATLHALPNSGELGCAGRTLSEVAGNTIIQTVLHRTLTYSGGSWPNPWGTFDPTEIANSAAYNVNLRAE